MWMTAGRVDGRLPWKAERLVEMETVRLTASISGGLTEIMTSVGDRRFNNLRGLRWGCTALS